MKNTVKRVTSLLLVLMMCLSLVPVFSLAEEGEGKEENSAAEEIISATDLTDEEEPEEILPEETLPEEAEEIPEADGEEDPAEDFMKVSALSDDEPADNDQILQSKYFPDDNLLNALKIRYHNSLTKAQAAAETQIQLAGSDIYDITGISRFFKGLTYLGLSGNSISEVDLSGCTKLKELTLSYNPLTSFDATGFSNLEEVDLCDTQVRTVKAAGLTKLKTLELDRTPVEYLDISGDSKIMRLWYGAGDGTLYAYNCKTIRTIKCSG